jgi:hypothetical protein
MTEEIKQVELKRPRSGYILFGIASRDNIKTENPEAQAKDILRLMGAAWGKLTDEEKEVYNAQYKEEKRVFEEAGGPALLKAAKNAAKKDKTGTKRKQAKVE